MNIEEIVSNMLNGEPIHDGIVIGIVFICFYAFYNAIFGGMFSLFKSKK